MHDEIELKLSLSPKNRDRLQDNELIRSLTLREPKTKTLVSTYFDTPNQDLRRKGMALRIRQIGEKRIQTLKARGNGQAGSLQHYREYEAELGRDQPDLDLIDDGELQALFREKGLAEALEPVFTTRVDRRTFPLKVEDSEVELAIDVGEIQSGKRRLPISEAELELVSGRPSRLYELALALGEKVGFRFERRTKAARGYGLREGSRPQPVKASGVKLEPGMTAAEAFAVAVQSCLTQIRVNEQVVLLGRDPEGVHQMRVGVRRLRAILRAFHRIVADDVLAYLRGELRWLQQRLGPAREWDVMIHETIEPMRAEMPGETSLDALLDAARRARSDAYRQARRSLGTGRYTALLLRLELWLNEGGWTAPGKEGKPAPGELPVTRHAAKSLRRRDRGLRKLGDKHGKLSLAELHRIRVQAKQVRYAAEVYRALFPAKAVKQQLNALEDIQDALGSLNDGVVSDDLLAGLVRKVERRDAAKAALLQHAAELVAERQRRRIEQDLKQFGECWSHYRAVEPYWQG